MILGNNSSVDANGFWEGMVIKKHNREIFTEGTSTISRKREKESHPLSAVNERYTRFDGVSRKIPLHDLESQQNF